MASSGYMKCLVLAHKTCEQMNVAEKLNKREYITLIKAGWLPKMACSLFSQYMQAYSYVCVRSEKLLFKSEEAAKAISPERERDRNPSLSLFLHSRLKDETCGIPVSRIG